MSMVLYERIEDGPVRMQVTVYYYTTNHTTVTRRSRNETREYTQIGTFVFHVRAR